MKKRNKNPEFWDYYYSYKPKQPILEFTPKPNLNWVDS